MPDDVEIVCMGCYGSGALFQPGDCPLCGGTGKEKVAWWAVLACCKCGGKFGNEFDFLKAETPNTALYYHSRPEMCIIVLSMEVGRLKSLLERYGYKEQPHAQEAYPARDAVSDIGQEALDDR